ncbi:MAG: apolipoprotein N-acyltransferase [Flavobacteriales bacterium]
MTKFLLLATCTGLALGLAWPAGDQVGLLFIGFVPLLWVVERLGEAPRKYSGLLVFVSAYLAFFSWNAIAIWWLHYVRDRDGSYMWEAYLLTVICNSLFMAILFRWYTWAKKRLGTGLGQLFLLCVWLSFEKLHFEWEFAWPWLNLGNGLANHPQWIQWYEYTGSLGGSLWIWLVNLSFFNMLKRYQKTRNWDHLYKNLILNTGMILLPILISYLIYANYNEKGPSFEFVILQPNIDPYTAKYSTPPKVLTQQLLDLTERSITNTTAFVLAPETALPGKGAILLQGLAEDSNVMMIKSYMKRYPESAFISGLELFSVYLNKETASKTSSLIPGGQFWVDVFNSAVQIDTTDTFQYYHKSKLVPGVEIFPYKKIFRPLVGNLLFDLGGTVIGRTPQDEPSVLTHPGKKIKTAPVICYESVFGEYISQFIQQGAQFICILTNDGWWGTSDGHKQHLAYARLRAIENRRAIARAGNIGVSAFVNQRGDIIASLPYGKEGTLRQSIRANSEKTFYTLYGDVIARIALLLGGVLFAYALAHQLMAKR